MYRKIRTLPKFQQHLFNVSLSAFCMIAPSGISLRCSDMFRHFPTICTLTFFLFVILASCNATCWLYGFLCAIFAAVWINIKCACPHWKPLPIGCLAETLCTCAITVSASFLTFHLTLRTDQAEAAKQQLAEMQREKMCASLLRAIPHDLRTHLCGISSRSLTYLENGDSLTDSEKTEIVRDIYEASTWLISITENLLAVTQIRENGLSISTRDELVEEVISEALQKIRKRHPHCAIQVSVPEEITLIPMDALLIEQVIINLLENALIHSGSSKPVELTAVNLPDCVSFIIRDHGKGIPKDMLEHLFEGTGHCACATRGAGVGLSICKAIITAHHGTIAGRSHADGAEFTFELPKRKEENHVSPNPHPSNRRQ